MSISSTLVDRAQIEFREAARCRAAKAAHGHGEVGLIEKSVFGGEGRGRAAGRVVHLVQRGLKPHDACVGLRAVADPGSHQAMQVTGTDSATSRQIRNPHASVLTLDLLKGCCDSAVQDRVLQTPQQEPLKNVDATIGPIRRELMCHEIMK